MKNTTITIFPPAIFMKNVFICMLNITDQILSLWLILISCKCSYKFSLFESVIGAKSHNETVDCEPFLC